MPELPATDERLRNAPANLRQLILINGRSYERVEKLLGVGKGVVGKWVRGNDRLTPARSRRIDELIGQHDVQQASGDTDMDEYVKRWPAMPELMQRLVRLTGSINKAALAAGVDAPTAYGIARGGREFTQHQIDKYTAALLNVAAVPYHHPRRGRMSPRIDSYPVPLGEFVHKHGSEIAAGHALGYKSSSVIRDIRVGRKKFDAKFKYLVEEALAGRVNAYVPSKAAQNAARQTEHDTGEMGLAIVVAPDQVVDDLWTAGEGLGGTWAYKRHQPSGDWLMILKLEDQVKLSVFRRLARLGADVVTP